MCAIILGESTKEFKMSMKEKLDQIAHALTELNEQLDTYRARLGGLGSIAPVNDENKTLLEEARGLLMVRVSSLERDIVILKASHQKLTIEYYRDEFVLTPKR
jgi:hypothetical protein